VSEAQYKGDDIPGFLGLQSGSQAPPGLYVGNVVWVYHTSTIKDNSGHAINLPGSLTSTAEIILVSVVTNYKLFGANVGGSAGFPFIKNRIQLNSLDVTTGLAYTDMFIGASLGWHLKRADITAGYNGDFTIRGVTKSEKLSLTLEGKGTGSGTVTGTMAFDRKDYGMDKGIPLVKIANRVEVTVDLKVKRVSGPPLVFKE
jgi:hypothetical protein